MKYYIALIKRKKLSFGEIRISLEDIILNKISQAQEDVFCMISLRYGV
jgi:hypothetical protein